MMAVLIFLNVIIIIVIIILAVILVNDKAIEIPNNLTTFEPPLPAMVHKTDRPRLIFAQDINYPPYAVLDAPPEG